MIQVHQFSTLAASNTNALVLLSHPSRRMSEGVVKCIDCVVCPIQGWVFVKGDAFV